MIVTPLRFVGAVIGLWIAARVIVLMPPLALDAEADVPTVAAATAAPRAMAPAASAGPSEALLRHSADEPAALPSGLRDGQPPARIASRPVPAAPGRPAGDPALPSGDDRAMPPAMRLAAADPPYISPAGIVAPPASLPAGVAPGSRWSGNLYLYRRGDGDAALASGGHLGGSQAGARIAYRLNRDGPARFAAAARVSTPLDDGRGAEAAAGLDWHPLPGRPLRLSIERRADIGGAGRNAWSAYAAGGFWRSPLPGIVIDGYAQAGVVGARRGDLFADGALRAGGRRELGGGRSITLGGGVWGAAQPRVARLDIGPRVAYGLPLAGTNVTAAAEWRIRVRGDASPRSGLALTLASDF